MVVGPTEQRHLQPPAREPSPSSPNIEPRAHGALGSIENLRPGSPISSRTSRSGSCAATDQPLRVRALVGRSPTGITYFGVQTRGRRAGDQPSELTRAAWRSSDHRAAGRGAGDRGLRPSRCRAITTSATLWRPSPLPAPGRGGPRSRSIGRLKGREPPRSPRWAKSGDTINRGIRPPPGRKIAAVLARGAARPYGSDTTDRVIAVHQPPSLFAHCTACSRKFCGCFKTMRRGRQIAEVFAAGEEPDRGHHPRHLVAGLIRHGHPPARRHPSEDDWGVPGARAGAAGRMWSSRRRARNFRPGRTHCPDG